MRFFKNKVEKQIEAQIYDLQMYLENNYKDLAIKALKDATHLLELVDKEGKLSEKSYTRYEKILSDYREEMKNYNHQQFYRTE